ncbi:hypothetical protein [Sphingomonas sp.]|uniref:hypothetical protein n=1 Tax=Sphingomonas sp. TaxID=28214 RepID=UPI002DD6A418|nr:hypothetical protein [Sphingomonas sp.]
MERSGNGPAVAPGVAVAEEGVVVLDGPLGVAVSMTPDAAEGTARSLNLAAADARAQVPR